ncbi:DUF502 domain-containing protein [Candidatus Bipolaricaulota bacterium]|nr:DUF502 domain-containing protein [Candidatus Bipolaricaulota bacterium]
MKRILAYIKNTFINGLLVILPVGFTFYILWLIYRMFRRFTGEGSEFGSLIGNFLRVTLGREWLPGIGAIFTLLLVFLVGLVTRIYVGRKVYSLLDRVMGSTPVVNKMYVTVKQIINAILSSESTTFRDVVMFEYPRRGTYVVGFVTNEDLGEVEEIIGEESVAAFIFTTPNPLSGMTVFLPKNDLTYLDLTVEEGLRLVLSMGIVIPSKFLDNNVGPKILKGD